MLRWLTKPTPGRVALWITLALLWFVLLIQALFPPTTHARFSVVGGVFWGVVEVGLLWAVVATQRRRRREPDASSSFDAR